MQYLIMQTGGNTRSSPLRLFVSIVLLCLVFTSSSGTTAVKGGRTWPKFLLTSHAVSLVDAANQLALDLCANAPDLNPPGIPASSKIGKCLDKSFLVSPTAIAIGLYALRMGAGGNTRDQLNGALWLDEFNLTNNAVLSDAVLQLNVVLHDTQTGSPQRSDSTDQRTDIYEDEEYTLKTAVGLYATDAITNSKNYPPSSYMNRLEKSFRTDFNVLDFVHKPEESRKVINNWVTGITDRKIPQLLSPGTVDRNTNLLLVTATFFSNSWENAFDPDLTSPGSFHVSTTRDITVDMMTSRPRTTFKYLDTRRSPKMLQGARCQVLAIPYRGEHATAYILLPDQGDFSAADLDDYGLTRLSTIVSSTTLRREVFDGLDKTAPIRLTVRLPKFNLQADWDLKKMMTLLGITDLLSRSDADLTGISSDGGLFVNDAVHSACLQVDEYGTEAAGAVELVTSQRVHGKPKGGHSTNDELVIDRPFLWFLVENLSKAILFAGRITCPTQTATASPTIG